MPDIGPYAIIGAGAAGLSAARTFKRDRIPFDVFEKHTDVGGLWNIDNSGSPVYESAHFISSKNHSALEGFPFPDDYPDYPSRLEVLAYLRDFARTFALYDDITFETLVERIEPAGSRERDGRGDGDGWTVRLAGGETRTYAGVVMASGNFWSPNLPAAFGQFTGAEYHSREYRSVDELEGRRVLVVGAGNTGCDIVCDAARTADEATISVRRGYRIIPKHVFGMPTLDFARTGPQLPGRMQQAVMGRLVDLLVGDLSRYGWPKADHPILASHPILNTRLVDYLAHGDVTARPDIAAVDGHKVRFTDGTVQEFDTIIWATGYHVSFPYLDDAHITWSGQNPNLFLNVFHRRYDHLFAMGVLEVDAGAFPILSLQAELIGQVIRDLHDNPRQASVFRRVKQTNPDLSGGIEHVRSGRHDYYMQDVAYRRYGRELLRRMRADELDTWAVPTTAVGRAVDAARRLASALR